MFSDKLEQLKAFALSEEKKMEDFPIWLKLVIWATIGLTAIYTLWGIVHSWAQV
jgi:hypothetical protein